MSRNHRLKQKDDNFFTNLPSEITIDILSRLPIETAMNCKLVSKSWRSLMETREFVNCYKSLPCLVAFHPICMGGRSKKYTFYAAKHIFDFVVYFAFYHRVPIHSSANGLLFLYDSDMWPCSLMVCNSVTREYITLPPPIIPAAERYPCDSYGFGVSKKSGQYKLIQMFHESYEIPPIIPAAEQYPCDSYGFGVSKKSGQYKLIQIFHESYEIPSDLHCPVYTLGTRLWRSIDAPALVFGIQMIGAFLNGNFHWFAHDPEGRPWISCFDLETELFTTLPPPPLPPSAPDSTFYDSHNCRILSALRDCLGLCDSSFEYEIVIWLMNEYGDDKSWTKQFVINLTSPRSVWSGRMCVLKVFEDGDVLLTEGGGYSMLCYSDETKALKTSDLVESKCIDDFSAVCYTPSFLPLATFFPNEYVHSF